jgi:N-acetylneuraminic acid mutarotase
MKALNTAQFIGAGWWRIGKLPSLISLLLLLAGVSPRLAAQANEWTWMGGSQSANSGGNYGTLGVPGPNNIPGAQSNGVTWTDNNGNLWLFGGYGFGCCGGEGPFGDLWKFNIATNEWTWLGGGGYTSPVYGTLGVPAAANAPGQRVRSMGWIDPDGKLWLFGGIRYLGGNTWGLLNDLWRFDPSTGQWTWMGGSQIEDQQGVYGTLGTPAAGNVPGAREYGTAWTDSSGNFWLFGGDLHGTSHYNDLWKFDRLANEWTWMGGSNTANQPGVYGTLGQPDAKNVPGARSGAAGWKDLNGNFWLFGGRIINQSLDFNDLWRFDPSTGEWTWMSGSNSAGAVGVYGTKGTFAAGTTPGARSEASAWTDVSGNLWLFGGVEVSISDRHNDLWVWNPSVNQWAWMGGSSSISGPGVFGTLGVPAPGNVPGARSGSAAWTDGSGDFWLFGSDGTGPNLFLNDFWKYVPLAPGAAPPPSTPSLTTPTPGSTLSGSTVTFAWSNPGNLAPRFVLRLSTAAFGLSDVFSGAANTGTTEQVSAIPAKGAYLYATLWYYLNGKWQYSNTRYTEAGAPTPPALTMPAPGSTLPGSTVAFGWDPGAGPTRFVLRLGTTFPGSLDVYSGASTTAASVQLTTIPTNGAKLYARLWYYLNEKWQYVDATYTEAGQ